MLTTIYKNNFMLYSIWPNIIDEAHEVIMKIVTECSIFYIQSMKAYVNVHVWTINHQEPWTATLKATFYRITHNLALLWALMNRWIDALITWNMFQILNILSQYVSTNNINKYYKWRC